MLEDKGGRVEGIVVRGISDPAAGKEAFDADTQDWRWIAARNAAEVLYRLITSIKAADLAHDNG